MKDKNTKIYIGCWMGYLEEGRVNEGDEYEGI
jgi:hypothetical protein